MSLGRGQTQKSVDRYKGIVDLVCETRGEGTQGAEPIDSDDPEAVDYTIVVSNLTDGDLTTPAILDGFAPNLVNVDVVDTLLGNLVLNGVAQAGVTLVESGDANGVMDVGEVWTITAARAPQPGDPDPLGNTATVTANVDAGPQGSGFDGGNDLSAFDDHSVDIFQPGIGLVKTGDSLGKIHTDDPELVDYTITVSNLTDGNLNTAALDGFGRRLGLEETIGASTVGELVTRLLAGEGAAVAAEVQAGIEDGTLTHLEAQGALSHRGQQELLIERGGDAIPPAQALHAGRGQDHPVESAVLELLPARVEVTPQLDHLQVLAAMQQLAAPTQASGRDDRALGKLVDAEAFAMEPGVAGILARAVARHHTTIGQLGRDILERMHGQIGSPFE